MLNIEDCQAFLFNDEEANKVLFNGEVIYEGLPDILYLYDKGANPNYPLGYFGGTHSAAYSENGARDEGTQVYLGAAASGNCHSAAYACHTKDKINITKFNKLVRTPTTGWCSFGICSSIPEGWFSLGDPSNYAAYTGYNCTELDISSFTGEYYIICFTMVYTTDAFTKAVTRFNQLYLTV